jgi:hypothetical protein
MIICVEITISNPLMALLLRIGMFCPSLLRILLKIGIYIRTKIAPTFNIR